ncbi:acyl-CoA dehydrogenase [Variovorax boronicumulans]|uniref:Acyl-CoA dehydrogenase n=1 Tax=Variovorax boronicumulans TaxID=436515 RepID=A0AAW8DPD8_9BURK|nr:acyl-CoA dehydrogenase family protein [Variovorax boronicumulans]MDP9875897.1 acyl-CoA dehydrogenase [Variovorax boronicumulans]MDP9917182.1 acyl-CoA dehydrogenase [Variovorax boronicumulans]MDP9921181.1 acyl-CoA dehydrogenase [Variovorax boronicumulans]
MIRDTPHFEALRADIRAFVRERWHPLEEQVSRDNDIPLDVVDELRRKGYFGWSIPEAYGGLGLTTEELVLCAMELSQSSVALRARVGTNTGIGSEALVADGTEAQKQRWLPRMATGELTGCLALTEPEAGSEASNVQTTARREGDHYVLNGSKRFITNAPVADVFTVIARTEDGSKGSKGVSAFLVERGPGLTTGAPYRMMGQAGSFVSDVHFDECRVHADQLIGGREGMGFQTVMKVLNKQRLHLAALCTGPAIRMLDLAMAHTSGRNQFGQAVADFQLVQAMIADSRTEIYAARSMILEAARARDRGEDVALSASMCKYFASEMCGRVADRAVQMFGGSGYVADFSPIERYYRDVRLFRLYEGTSQIHQLNIAKLALREAGAR